MKYKTGDEVYDISRDRIGVVLSVGEDTYELALDGYDLPLFVSENSLILLDDIGRLQAENERLKAAINQVLQFFLPEDTEGAIEVLYAVMESETK